MNNEHNEEDLVVISFNSFPPILICLSLFLLVIHKGIIPLFNIFLTQIWFGNGECN